MVLSADAHFSALPGGLKMLARCGFLHELEHWMAVHPFVSLIHHSNGHNAGIVISHSKTNRRRSIRIVIMIITVDSNTRDYC